MLVQANKMLRDINEIRRINALYILQKRFEANKKIMADAMGVSDAYLGRILSIDVAQPRNIGDEVARKIEVVAQMPPNWLDHDHDRLSAEMEALIERYRRSDAETQAMIQLALDDPAAPIPESMRPSLKLMIQAVRMTVAQHVSA